MGGIPDTFMNFGNAVSETMPAAMKIFIFVFGLCCGSFFNAFIYRYQAKVSIWRKARSFCPLCKRDIAWFDNIPLLSYVVLGGKCRNCKGKISPRYFVVELLTGLLFLLIYQHFLLNYTHAADKTPIYSIGRFISMLAFFGGLVIITFVDIDMREIPDEISLTGIFVGPVLSAFFPDLQLMEMSGHKLYLDLFASPHLNSLLASLTGLALGGGSIWLLGIAGEAIFKKEAMGFGDVKLMAMAGAFLGPLPVMMVFFIAPFFGSIIGIIILIVKKDHYIPYGPFLALAMLIVVLYKWAIIGAFLAYAHITDGFDAAALPEKFLWF